MIIPINHCQSRVSIPMGYERHIIYNLVGDGYGHVPNV